MNIKNGSEAREVTALAQALADDPVSGTTLLRAADQARLPLARARRLLAKHTDYFVAIANSEKYALNRFGPFRGQLPEIRASIEQEVRASRTRKRAAAAALLILILVFIGTR